jgi:iron complex outermembrane receptor protein
MKKYLTPFLLSGLCAFAQEKPDSSGKSPLLTLQSDYSEHTFVTASKSERRQDTLPANVTVITAEDVQKSTARTASDLLKNLAGIEVKQYSGTTITNKVDIRGFGEVGEANTLILVDGRKVNRPDMGVPDLTVVPLNRIERVEVLRGGAAVLYGDGAVGGVVNIITKKRQEEGHTLTLQSEYSSDETYSVSAILEGRDGKTSYSLDSSYTDSESWRDNNYFRSESGGFSILSQELENWDLFLSGGFSENRAGAPSYRPAGGKRTDAFDENGYSEYYEKFLTFSPRYWITEKASLQLDTSYRESESDLFTDTFGFPWAAERGRLREYSISPKYIISQNFGELSSTTTVGIDYSYAYTSEVPYVSKQTKRSTGYYIHNTLGLLDETLFIDSGYRRERVRLHHDTTSFDFSPVNLDAFNFGLTYNYAPRSKVYASVDKSFRTQRVTEQGGPGFDELLDPQTSYTYEVGISHHFSDLVSASAALFRIETQNEIFFETNPSLGGLWGNGENVSYDHTTREGVELGLNLYPCENLQLYANYTYIDATLGGNDLTADAAKGNDIPGVARERLNAGFCQRPLRRKLRYRFRLPK